MKAIATLVYTFVAMGGVIASLMVIWYLLTEYRPIIQRIENSTQDYIQRQKGKGEMISGSN